MIRCVLFTLFILFSFRGYSQPVSRTDSLLAFLETATPDTSKVNLLNNLAHSYQASNPKAALSYGQQALELAQQLGFLKGEASAWNRVGVVHALRTEYRQASECFLKSLDLSKAIGYREGISGAYNNLALIYNYQDHPLRALDYYYKALPLAEEAGQSVTIANVLTNIGNIYLKLKNYPEALEHYNRAYRLFEKAMHKDGIASVLMSIGNVYENQENYVLAEEHYTRSLEICRNINDFYLLPYSLNHLGSLYTRMNRYEQARGYYRQALEAGEKVGDKIALMSTLHDMGINCQQTGNRQEALTYLHRSLDLARQLDKKSKMQEVYKDLAENYELARDYESAYRYARLSRALRDSIYSEENTRKINNMQADYEMEKKQTEISVLTKEQQAQKSVRNVLVGSLGFCFVVAMILWRGYNQKKRLNHLLINQYGEINRQKEEIESQAEYLQHANGQITAQRDLIEEKNRALQTALTNFQQAQLQLIQAERMASIGQLTAGIAHEINNPVNFVYSGIHSLKLNINDLLEVLSLYEQVTPENAAMKLQEIAAFKEDIVFSEAIQDIFALTDSIEDGAARTSEIVKSLRTFSRLDEDVIKPVELNENINATLTMLGSQLGSHIRVVKAFGELPPMECFPGQLNQVLLHLITNAAQSIEKEGHITISTRYDTEQSQVVLSVKDTGRGMNEAIKARIFEPFFTTREVGKGRGLGLPICLGIIHNHRGSIEVHSEEGKGTEVTVRFCERLETRD